MIIASWVMEMKNDSGPTVRKTFGRARRSSSWSPPDETLQVAEVCPIFKLVKTTAGDRKVAAPPLQIDHPFRSTPGIDRHSPFRVVCL